MLTFQLLVIVNLSQFSSILVVALWTGFKQHHSASDDAIGPNEEIQFYQRAFRARD